MGCFVCTVCYYSFYFWKVFYKFIIYIIKCYAIVNIAGCYYCFKNKTIFVTSCVSLICKLPLMFTFYEKSAFGISCALGDFLCFFCFLTIFEFLLRCVIFFLAALLRSVIIVKGFLSVFLSVVVDFF